jgi:O-antigen ligase
LEKTQRTRPTPLSFQASAAGSSPDRLLSWPASQSIDTLPLARLAASVLMFALVLFISATTQHPLAVVAANSVTIAVRALVPLAAAFTAALCVWRPTLAYAIILALTPAWNSAQIEASLGSFQMIDQTVFVVALLVGCAVIATNRPHPQEEFDYSAAWERLGLSAAGGVARSIDSRRRYRAHTFAEVAAAGIVVLAILSTVISPDPGTSANVFMHGILEPVAMAGILIWLRPSRREIAIVGAGLAIAVADGSALNVLQSLSQYKTISGVLTNRLYFSWYTYGNVGTFGVIVAATLPIEIGLLVLRKRLGLSRPIVGLLLVVIGLTLAGLFFSLSKSAWLSAFVSMAALMLFLMRSWRQRIAVTMAALVISAVYIPWPALVLQVAPPVDNAYSTAIADLVGKSRFDSWNPETLTGHGSMAERYYAVEGGVMMALDHPILGVGLDQFGRYYAKGSYRPKEAAIWLDNAHSLFPEVAAELGFPAATLLAALVAASLWAMWRASRKARDDLTRILALSILAAIAGWVLAATAFGCVIYRATANQASDMIAFAVLISMAVALARITSPARAGGLPKARS